MPLRVGVDMVDGEKFRRVLVRNPGLLHYLFVARELGHCLGRPNSWQRLTAVFAAKEACLKALGRGLWAVGLDQALQEIQIIPVFPARILLHGATARHAQRRGLKVAGLSLARGGRYCTAVVVLEDSVEPDQGPEDKPRALLPG